MKLKLDVPVALPSKLFSPDSKEYCWEDWHNDTKSKYPVRYWLQFTFPKFVRYYLKRPVSDLWYWIRTHTYNRYHIVDLRCPNYGLEYKWGWIDRSEAVLIAPFQLLKDFMENEFYHTVDWDGTEYHKAAAKELKELYNWWMVERVKEHEEYTKRLVEKDKDHSKYLLLAIDSENLDKKDTDMLIRLAKVRGYMWT